MAREGKVLVVMARGDLGGGIITLRDRGGWFRTPSSFSTVARRKGLGEVERGLELCR